MARLKSLIFPGENILLREERPFGEVAVRVFAPFAAAGGMFMALYRSIEHIGGWHGSLGIGIVLLMIFLLSLGMELPFLSAISNLRADHWRIAVTDKRVLVRRGLLGGGHDEMMRYDIENCLYDRTGGKIVLTGAGRELAIDCSQAQAERILKTLGRDEAGN